MLVCLHHVIAISAVFDRTEELPPYLKLQLHALVSLVTAGREAPSRFVFYSNEWWVELQPPRESKTCKSLRPEFKVQRAVGQRSFSRTQGHLSTPFWTADWCGPTPRPKLSSCACLYHGMPSKHHSLALVTWLPGKVTKSPWHPI